jgi:hypothetical protein
VNALSASLPLPEGTALWIQFFHTNGSPDVSFLETVFQHFPVQEASGLRPKDQDLFLNI